MNTEKMPLMVRVDEAKALSDEVRALILDLLTKQPMSVHEIVEELKKRGLYKSINTVRYHLQVLKDAGLIELVATKEVKGGVLKYYSARRKVYLFEVPDDVAEVLKPLVSKYYLRVRDLMLEMLEKDRDVILNAAKKLKPCPYCITRHFAEYIVLESLRQILGKAIHDEAIVRKLSEFRVSGEEGEG